jgi:hypothetical protein
MGNWEKGREGRRGWIGRSADSPGKDGGDLELIPYIGLGVVHQGAGHDRASLVALLKRARGLVILF